MRAVIVEGPDGSGKTTIATAIARRMQATLIHHGSYLKARPRELWMIYAHSFEMWHAGVSSVVLDRSWLSEPIYGAAARGGACRTSAEDVKALEGLAKGAMVVLCLPPLEACLEAFRSRPTEEYLKKESLLKEVHAGYSAMRTSLDVLPYDRTRDDMARLVERLAGES